MAGRDLWSLLLLAAGVLLFAVLVVLVNVLREASRPCPRTLAERYEDFVADMTMSGGRYHVHGGPAMTLVETTKDAWGNDPVYEVQTGGARITSYGADGALGGRREAADMIRTFQWPRPHESKRARE